MVCLSHERWCHSVKPGRVHKDCQTAATEHMPWQVPDCRHIVWYKELEQSADWLVADNCGYSYADLYKNIHITICRKEKNVKEKSWMLRCRYSIEFTIMYCENGNPALKYLIEKKYQQEEKRKINDAG